MQLLNKILALSISESWLLFTALLGLPLLSHAIRVHGFKQAYNKSIVSSFTTDKQKKINEAQLSEARAIARIINIAGNRSIFKANCLAKSLYLLRELRKRQIPCQLKIGTTIDIGKTDGLIKNRSIAHAWVESEGLVLNDAADVGTRFNAFTLPEGNLK